MTESEYLRIKEMVDKLIAFIRWKGAPFQSKQNKVIKELSLIKQFCLECTNDKY